jgi:predicted O-linked N-acetylglucosamine transferase (SPINDLY family)
MQPMESLLVEPVRAEPDVDTGGVMPVPVDAAGWLAALLGAYTAHAVTPEQTPAIQARLKQISFADIVTALERARPGLAGHAERCLYQDWIASNAGGASPHLFAAWFNLGVVLARDGDRANAVIAYSNARALKADFYEAAVNLGLALEAMGQTDAALQTWTGALQTNQARTALLNHKGRLMEQLRRLDEAEAALHASLLTDPAQPDAVQHWLHIRQKMCQWPILTADVPGLPSAELQRQSGALAVLALTDDVAVQREVAASWITRKMPAAPLRLSPPEGYRHDRLRIGYLSSDFCRHAMSYLIAELFERHDRRRFEIFGYCSTIEDGSDIRRRVLAAFDHRRIVLNLSDEQAARVIRNDEIDILIDLNGLTAHSRLAVLRWRPAPIQATYLGFIGPVPLPELDYLLCDDFVVPPQQAASYRPEPLRIAGIYQANDSKRVIAPALSRSEAGLPEDRFVLCCFSNHYKITEDMFAAWMAILRNVDRAVLWLAADNAWSHANLREAAARAGVAPERIIFAQRTSPELYMSRLARADLFLDTFPYNAGTIASDALRMGLPLLTLCGRSFASRMAGCLLHAIGARLGIATSMAEYVATATLLATNARVYADYKSCFTPEAWNSTLGNIGQFTAEFEATLARLPVQARIAA